MRLGILFLALFLGSACALLAQSDTPRDESALSEESMSASFQAIEFRIEVLESAYSLLEERLTAEREDYLSVLESSKEESLAWKTISALLAVMVTYMILK